MTTLTPESHTWRIIAVDDNRSNLEVLQIMLKERGKAEVEITTDSDHAIEHILKFQPNLILLDIMMSTTGIELFRRLRHDLAEQFKHVPIIAVTAAVMDKQKKELEAAGFDGCIEKPFESESLLDTIKTCVEKFLKK